MSEKRMRGSIPMTVAELEELRLTGRVALTDAEIKELRKSKKRIIAYGLKAFEDWAPENRKDS